MTKIWTWRSAAAAVLFFCGLATAVVIAATGTGSANAVAARSNGRKANVPAFDASATTCESLISLALPQGTITQAETVEAGAFSPPQQSAPGAAAPTAFKELPAFCRVAATLRPTSHSDIKIEVWMPEAGSWNGRIEAVGNGGWAGTISYGALAAGLAHGYAASSTDTGHRGSNPSFATGHPEKLVDFVDRALHVMTVASKQIVAAYYSRAAAHSYYSGCSTGGRQGLTAVQRFPGDYDGVLVGDPNNDVTGVQGMQVWTAQISHRDATSYIPPEKYRVIHDAVLQACDALDGVKDGVLDDPRRCHFDPAALRCKKGDEPSCLTDAQVKVVREIYAGPIDEATGRTLSPGLEPGSELGWTMLLGPKPGALPLAADTFGLFVFHNPNWNYLSFDPARDIATANKAIGGLMNATDPNLELFFSHGGKLLMYHGWSDPGISPQNSINYYLSVVDETGGTAKAENSIRLFMVPGMNHCRGGDGPDTFDGLGAVVQWVEHGKAPDRIIASRIRNGAVDRTRPLCPYPEVARYTGTGSTDDAANFACRLP